MRKKSVPTFSNETALTSRSPFRCLNILAVRTETNPLANCMLTKPLRAVVMAQTNVQGTGGNGRVGGGSDKLRFPPCMTNSEKYTAEPARKNPNSRPREAQIKQTWGRRNLFSKGVSKWKLAHLNQTCLPLHKRGKKHTADKSL